MRMSIVGLHKLTRSLERLHAKMAKDKDASVSVGYTMNYALPVHERVRAKHTVGESKYLEKPFREYRTTIANLIKDALKRGATLEQALMVGGLRLQRESQALVPIDTGALRASAFTSPTRDEDRAAEASRQRGEVIRKKALKKRAKKGGSK